MTPRSRSGRVLLAVGILGLAGVVAFVVSGPDPEYRFKERLHSRRYHAQEGRIQAAAARHGLDPHLVRALVWRESRFRPDKQGAHGERGLMQVGEAAARDWQEGTRVPILQPSDLFDPHTNLEVGCWYLARGMRRWADHPAREALALAEYNAGFRSCLLYTSPSPRD